jgi:DNA-binding CsgD family transcriptional regulator
MPRRFDEQDGHERSWRRFLSPPLAAAQPGNPQPPIRCTDARVAWAAEGPAMKRQSRGDSGSPAQVTARRLGLSDREIEVLALLAHGLTDRTIAAELNITTKTAGHHVSHILAKLHVERRGQAAAIAFGIGLAEPGFAGVGQTEDLRR